jgi:molybdopterin converting factor small subunit
MAMATVRLNGLLSRGIDNTHQVYFDEKRIRLKTVIFRMKLEIPEKSVAFFAINGTKAAQDSWINDGDIIDVFPVVAGG